MSRLSLVLALALFAPVAGAADPPPGALVRLGDDRFRAGAGVSHLVISPDGKRFATVRSADKGDVALGVWDSTGRLLHEHKVSGELFRGLVWGKGGAFAIARGTAPGDNGKYLKVVPDDFRVWDITDPGAAPPQPLPVIDRGRTIHDAPPQYDAEYSDFQFSADGSRVAALWAGANGKHAVHVFALKPAKTAAQLDRVGTLDLGAEGAGAVRTSADGRSVVTFRRLVESDSPPGADYVATVWDADAGKPAKPVRVSSVAGTPPKLSPGERDRITYRLLLTPDGRGVITHAVDEKTWGFDRSDVGAPVKRCELLRLPHNSTGEFKERAGGRDSGAHAFFPSGDALAVAFDRQTVIFDCVAGKVLGRLEGHAQQLTAVAVSADGGTIATADLYGLVRLWDAKTFRPRNAPTGHRLPVEHAELSHDGKRLLTWAPDETVRLWDVATGKELRAFAGVPGIREAGGPSFACPTFTPDGTAVLFSTADRLVSRDFITTLEVPLPGELEKLGPRRVQFSPDGKALLTWAEGAPVAVYDWPTGTKRIELKDVRPFTAPGFTADGAAVFVGGDSPYWSATTGTELDPAGAKPLAARRLTALTADGRTAAQEVPNGGAVQLVEAATGGARRTLRGHRGRVSVLGFTPDGSRLLTAGGDQTVLVWDVRLSSVPLPDALKLETDAAKLWAALAAGKTEAAYLAMARLAREPDAAVKLAALKMRAATTAEDDTDETRLADGRAVELLEALGTPDAHKLLKELASGHADAFRTQDSKRALKRPDAGAKYRLEK